MLPFSDEELKPAVENMLDKIRPTLALDGGNVTLIEVKGPSIYVRLEGACVGCPSSDQTLKFGIEQQLRANIHPDLEIVNVPPGMEERLEEL